MIQKLEHDAFEHKREEKALQERNRQLHLLNQSGQILNSSLDLDHVLTSLLEEVRRFMDVAGSSIWLKDTITREIVCRQAAGLQKDVVRGWRMPEGEGIAGWVSCNGKGQIVQDTRRDNRHFKAVDKEMGLEIRSILSVPVKGRNGTIGALQMVDTEVDRFDETHLEMMKPLASSSAIAIENARLYGQAQDEIYERKKAEEALMESEERYRILFEHSPIGLGIADEYGNIIACNDSMLRPGGYQREDISEKNNISELYYDSDARKKVLETVSRQGFVDDFETQFKRKDSTPYSALLSLRPVKVKEKHCLNATVQDITDRKKMEEQILHQNKLLEGINKVFHEALTCQADAQVASICLEVAEELTNSKFGLMGEVNPAGRFDTIAISNPGWDACKMSDSEATVLIKDMEIRGIDRSTIRNETSRIVNDLTSHPDRLGTPKGHPPVNSFLGVPLKQAGKTIGMIGLGNKESGYDLADQQAIEALSIAFVEALMRKRAEEALRESEEKYRSIFDSVTDALLIIDYDGNIAEANPQACEMYGYSHEEMVGLAGKNAVHPDYYYLFEELKKSVQEKGEFYAEAVHLRKDGTLISIEVRGGGFLFKGKQHLLVVVRDISERKQAEEALQASEEKYRRFAENALIGVFQAEKGGKIIMANMTMAGMFGYDSPESLISSVDSIANLYVRPEERPTILREIDEKGFVYGKMIEFRKKDGKTFWVKFHTKVIREKEKTIYEGLMEDITESKRVAEALKESEKRFRTVADFNYDWETWVGLDGKYIYVSPSCERITGYSAEEFMKDPGLFTRIVHPDDRESFSAHVEGHLKGAGDNHIDFRVVTRGDDIRWISHYCQPVYDDEGDWLGMRASNRDITDRMKLSEQLLQSQKMEAVGRLAGGVAHDFNNLLTTIIGYSNIMLTQVDKESPLRSGMEEIKMASDRAASLTGQLLAFSRKQMIQPVVLNLNYPLTEMEKMLRRLIGEDIDLITVLEPELWQVKFDPGQIAQVVMNLAVNARDAMPKGGKLTIETANVDLDEAYAHRYGVDLRPGPFVMVAVSDTGMGIDKEIQFDIFEPFFTTKEKGKGTGLGLSTVYGIVKQSEGFIWVYSELGQGTTFNIYLPKAEAEEEFVEEEQMQPQNLEGSETILLAEDDDSARKLIRSVLQEHGYRVLEAQDGKEALRLSEQHEGPIHLLLTDVVMPGMNGRELAERLQPLQSKMKVLYISGYTDNAIVHNGVLEPGVPFIQKPFTPIVLVSRVREILDTC